MAVIENLPSVLQNETVREVHEYRFTSEQNVYQLKEGPVTTVFTVTDENNTYVEGDDYQLLTNNNGQITDIDWGIGGNSPNPDTIFYVDQQYQSILYRYLDAHDMQIEELEADIDRIIDSHSVETATERDLERVGALFGELGRRSGRSDEEYRTLLKSIVNSFSGRGSRGGLKFAIAAAIGTTPDNVNIVEDFENLRYTIVIENVDSSFLSSAINDLAELADPSGVELEDAVITTEGNTLTITRSMSTVTSESVGLGGDTLTLDGNSTLG